MLEGELFSPLLRPGDPVPVVVNQALALRYFPNDSPVGRRITFDREPDEDSYWYSITGVVGNERLSASQEPRPEIINHLIGDAPRTMRFTVRTVAAPHLIVPVARNAVHALDPGIPMGKTRTMAEVANHALSQERFLMTLLFVFAAAALLLTAVGLYGVAAQGARSRRREVGIRVALGAQKGALLVLLLKRAGMVTAIGLAIGGVGALASGRLIESLLFEVEANDPLNLLASGAILAIIALIAGYVPARRALKAEPAQVLSE